MRIYALGLMESSNFPCGQTDAFETQINNLAGFSVI